MKSSPIPRTKQVILVFMMLLGINWGVYAAEDPTPTPEIEYFKVTEHILEDGTVLEEIIIGGPPEPPVGYAPGGAELPESGQDSSLNTLKVVPFDLVKDQLPVTIPVIARSAILVDNSSCQSSLPLM